MCLIVEVLFWYVPVPFSIARCSANSYDLGVPM